MEFSSSDLEKLSDRLQDFKDLDEHLNMLLKRAGLVSAEYKSNYSDSRYLLDALNCAVLYKQLDIQGIEEMIRKGKGVK